MTERKRRGESHSRKSLVFLEALIAATPDELGRMNTAIRAARIELREHLPGGAGTVIAEGIADPEIARMLELLEQKRKAPIFRGSREQKGQTREQIRATAQRKREAAEARRREREQERQRQREARKHAGTPPD